MVVLGGDDVDHWGLDAVAGGFDGEVGAEFGDDGVSGLEALHLVEKVVGGEFADGGEELGKGFGAGEGGGVALRGVREFDEYVRGVDGEVLLVDGLFDVGNVFLEEFGGGHSDFSFEALRSLDFRN